MDNGDSSLVTVDVVNVLVSENHFLVLLKERGGAQRVVPISVGIFEANGIIMAMENVKTKRPFTYDIVKTLLEGSGAQVDHLAITRLEAGIYYGLLYVKTRDGISEYDIRPSDGIALSLRFQSPIFVAERVFLQAGKDNKTELLEDAMDGLESLSDIGQDIGREDERYTGDEEEIDDPFFNGEMPGEETETHADAIDAEMNELQINLEKAVTNERYEEAALIRDRINELKKKYGRS